MTLRPASYEVLPPLTPKEQRLLDRAIRQAWRSIVRARSRTKREKAATLRARRHSKTSPHRLAWATVQIYGSKLWVADSPTESYSLFCTRSKQESPQGARFSARYEVENTGVYLLRDGTFEEAKQACDLHAAQQQPLGRQVLTMRAWLRRTSTRRLARELAGLTPSHALPEAPLTLEAWERGDQSPYTLGAGLRRCLPLRYEEAIMAKEARLEEPTF